MACGDRQQSRHDDGEAAQGVRGGGGCGRRARRDPSCAAAARASRQIVDGNEAACWASYREKRGAVPALAGLLGRWSAARDSSVRTIGPEPAADDSRITFPRCHFLRIGAL